VNDIEDLVLDIRTHLIANLNTKIAEINTEKNADDSDFDLSTIDADNKHYLIMGRYREIPNYDFVNIGIASPPDLGSNAGNIRITTPLMVEVVIPNDKKEDTYFKSLRYMRAVYEVMATYEALEFGTGGLQLTGALPMEITTNRRELIVSGVLFEVTLG
jgi:hypothetical protein